MSRTTEDRHLNFGNCMGQSCSAHDRPTQKRFYRCVSRFWRTFMAENSAGEDLTILLLARAMVECISAHHLCITTNDLTLLLHKVGYLTLKCRNAANSNLPLDWQFSIISRAYIYIAKFEHSTFLTVVIQYPWSKQC